MLSVITLAEIHRLWHERRLTKKVKEERQFLKNMTIVDFTEASARAHGSLYRAGFRGHGVDGLIAAQCLELGAQIITQELHGFRDVHGLLRVLVTQDGSEPTPLRILQSQSDR
jgi:predicted nucleic acid-binding protein